MNAFFERVFLIRILPEAVMPRLPLSEQEREQVRQRILSVAQELFDTQGIQAVSMRAIGTRVGLVASALYAYFPAKQDLIRALWQGALDELENRFRDLSAQEPNPLKALVLLARAYTNFALENPVRFRLLFLTSPAPGKIDAEFDGLPQTRIAYDLLRDRVAEAIAKGSLRIVDADLASQTLWSAIHGVLALNSACTNFPLHAPQLLAETMLETVLRGMLQENGQGE